MRAITTTAPAANSSDPVSGTNPSTKLTSVATSSRRRLSASPEEPGSRPAAVRTDRSALPRSTVAAASHQYTP